MKIYQVTEERFKKYGKIIKNIDFSSMIEALKKLPVTEGVVYEPSVSVLEALPAAKEAADIFFGELDIQVGYCSGHNLSLNAVEYHRSSEINAAATDAVLMLGQQADIADDYTYDTAKLEVFFLPAGTAVELYATTLHYAPCHVADTGFQVAVILPKGTNTPLKKVHQDGEDALLTAKNKWLIGHSEGGLPEGSYIGLTGSNLKMPEHK